MKVLSTAEKAQAHKLNKAEEFVTSSLDQVYIHILKIQQAYQTPKEHFTAHWEKEILTKWLIPMSAMCTNLKTPSKKMAVSKLEALWKEPCNARVLDLYAGLASIGLNMPKKPIQDEWIELLASGAPYFAKQILTGTTESLKQFAKSVTAVAQETATEWK